MPINPKVLALKRELQNVLEKVEAGDPEGAAKLLSSQFGIEPEQAKENVTAFMEGREPRAITAPTQKQREPQAQAPSRPPPVQPPVPVKTEPDEIARALGMDTGTRRDRLREMTFEGIEDFGTRTAAPSESTGAAPTRMGDLRAVERSPDGMGGVRAAERSMTGPPPPVPPPPQSDFMTGLTNALANTQTGVGSFTPVQNGQLTPEAGVAAGAAGAVAGAMAPSMLPSLAAPLDAYGTASLATTLGLPADVVATQLPWALRAAGAIPGLRGLTAGAARRAAAPIREARAAQFIADDATRIPAQMMDERVREVLYILQSRGATPEVTDQALRLLDAGYSPNEILGFLEAVLPRSAGRGATGMSGGGRTTPALPEGQRYPALPEPPPKALYGYRVPSEVEVGYPPPPRMALPDPARGDLDLLRTLGLQQ